jgi:hypothetical protein
MDRIKKYQENIIQFLEKYAQRKYANMPEVENQVIADLERNHFSLMSVGWHNDDFVHSCVFHFDIKDGKIWIQANWTEIDVAEKLVEMECRNRISYWDFSRRMRGLYQAMQQHDYIGKRFFFFPPPSVKLLNSTLQLLSLTNH